MWHEWYNVKMELALKEQWETLPFRKMSNDLLEKGYLFSVRYTL